MHGLGNDFVVVDGLVPGAPTPAQVQPHLEAIGHRRFGVGYDQFLFVQRSDVADFAMPIFNPDGSEAEMCGNGIRAFAKYVYDRGYTTKTTLSVDTLAGVKTLDLSVEGGKVSSVTVDMGEPGIDRTDIGMIGEVGPVVSELLEVNHEPVRITGVSMGNPHVVLFADEATEAEINNIGPVLECHPRFPRRTNVHLVQVLGPTELKILTWERGAGRTLACGTGACACVVAANLNGLAERHALCHLPGGDLFIRWDDVTNHVFMTGPAVEVFTGEIPL
jgi:diaminopimelate epimerase